MISYDPMAMKCSNCVKGIMYGHNVSHAKNRTTRVFKPNLHSARIKVGSNYVRMKLCTKCLRMYKNMQAVMSLPLETVVTETPTTEATA